jgi:hypothetical protein
LVDVLEAQRRASAPTNADAPQPVSTPTPQAADSTVQSASLTPELHELHGIQWRGFGEVDYKCFDRINAAVVATALNLLDPSRKLKWKDEMSMDNLLRLAIVLFLECVQ